jgi:hypothetical protein
LRKDVWDHVDEASDLLHECVQWRLCRNSWLAILPKLKPSSV